MSVVLDTVYPILGYQITEQIYSGSKTLVYRGIREKDQRSVILKLMRNEYPTFIEIAQFRNQYTITKNLDLPGIVKPYSLESYRNGYVLVMDDFGGISLKDWRRKEQKSVGSPVSLNEFFHIAIEISSTLEGLHRHRIIHKDVKPANILIHPVTNDIRLIDFSLATLLPKEIQVLTNPNVLEGTLAYISPEQTGRMNRGIDYRTDFYSLGITFFELLTGQLPFSATEPMELVHSHIAKEPPKANRVNSHIPPILSEIISKLMAKNAEDRYQSAHGLRYDLEVCQNQWQETGNITNFDLGVKDISNRFVIPEKLYGRKHEVETLLAAFDRVTSGKTEMILVAGFSGIGKTAVVNEIHKPIVRQRSYFIKGKFDQFQRDIPFSALVQAFRDLIGQILSESDAQIQQWKAKVLLALGTQASVITNVIPELEKIIGKQPLVTELYSSAAQNRFNLLFPKFLRVFTTKEHPLVIFLDDLQWADTASLQLIQLLMSENTSSPFVDERENIVTNHGNLLLIGAYRDNEVSNAHPLYLTLKEIAKTKANVHTINLAPLSQTDLNHLIADALHCRETITVSLTQMVFAKTKGNPFFATQFLKSLYEDGLVTLNFEAGYWQYDIEKIKILSLTDDVVDFMAIQIGKLPKNTQKVLKLAACIGNEFDLKTIAIIHEKSVVDTASDLWLALLNGLVLPQSDVYNFLPEDDIQQIIFNDKKSAESSANNYHLPRYKFVHDRVQQAAYSLIPEDQKKAIHLRIGLLLLSNTPVAEREEKIFDLVNQFNIAVQFITRQIKRNELAAMNLTAGNKALASTAYSAAIKYLNIGIELLANDSWDSKYELTLALYETATEAAYLSGNFKQMQKLAEVVLAQANTPLEKVKTYEVIIQAYGAQNKALEGVKTGLTFLKLLGIEFPEDPSQTDIQKEMELTNANLANKSIEDLIDLPEMTAAAPLAMMRILSRVIALAYQTVPELMPLICLKQINLSLKHGNSPLSAFTYVVYGLMLCGPLNDIEVGYQFGKLAVNLLSQFNLKETKAKVIQTFNAHVRHWKEPIRKTLKPLLSAYSAALETGDLEFAAYSLYSYCYISYFSGKELTELEREMTTYGCATNQLKQNGVLNWIQIYRQAVLNIMGATQNPCYLIGEAYNEEQSLAIQLAANDQIALLYLYLCKLHLCYLFADYPQAVENAVKAEQYLSSGTGQFVVPQFYFYNSLALLATYLDVELSQQTQILTKVVANQEKIRKWADYMPINHLHKFYLVEAERYRVLGQYLEAMDYYDLAVSLAKENEYLHEEALANELAAKFYLEWGKTKIGQTYLIDAYYAYVRWGALAKVNDLQKCYPQLLAAIIQQEKLSLQTSDRSTPQLSTFIPLESTESSLSTNETAIGSNTSISDMLDLAAVIKASQAVSGEIELEELLSTLIEVLMENAGASKCVLILSDANNLDLTITAVSSSSTFTPTYTEFPAIPLESSYDVPITLINYVKRTREILVIDDAKAQASLTVDLYITREEPKSLLCIPMINQNKLLGILYLENNLTTGAFTRDRLEILKLLTAQAAISLENAMLYKNLAQANERLEEYNHTLEEKVTTRTAELNEKNHNLQQTLQELQHTQTQLIQSEKMSSLGEMVAGIAHEINNPINFIHGNIAHASDYVQDLLDLIAVYQQEYPQPSVLVDDKAEEIDIDFLAQDLPKILNSMKVGSSRIRNIVLSLRNFSRLDEAEMKPVDIHEGIDNTLMILQHRIKKVSTDQNSSEIEIIKEYGKLSEVTCYASQLNQVFMNILSNAIDALEESVVNANMTAKPQIRICTELVNPHIVRIKIADNGSGMKEAVRQKIFDPFFTTKPIGSGTGLGLSISYQIVVDKHKGHLTCVSQLGKGTEFLIEIPR
ncbi:trifunctional serine/threonine-protein kinase/ATP-binding protein/sensor histidine kinase [Halotia branconii]|uniref:histidine kinase n=1 Tax=Halotia branconii CENA392 TaxID=1539056 RepID=A0AAJ6NWA2_9CYAN|nr:ATP-binding sensor histidine kinase [Halotia branconii]WGV27668.1 AAA family ATPase [Halotia branconii CENA392]